MASAWAIVVSLALLLAGRTADAQVVDDCPAKSGEVFRIGLLNPVPEFTVSTLLAVEDVNVNAFAGMPTLGCFPFNLTLIRDEGPADEVCLDDPDFPYGEESDYGATECEPSSICFPRNMIWQNTMCSGSLGAPAAEAMLADGVMAIVGPHCSDVAMSVHDTLRAGNVPYISWATSSKLSDETAYPYHFRTAGPDGAQARAMVDIALQLNATSASILSDTSSISQTFAEDIIDILNPIDGFELRAHQVINFEENNPSRADEPLPDYVAAITALADAEADVTFAVYRPYLDSYCRNAREVLEASGDQDYETTWIHSDYLSYPTCVPDGFEGQILATKVRSISCVCVCVCVNVSRHFFFSHFPPLFVTGSNFS